MASIKWVDYERTPEVVHILPKGDDGKEKIEREPAKMVFIGSNGERREVTAGGGEEEVLMEQVIKNNPAAHAREKKVANGPKKIMVTKVYLESHPELVQKGVKAGSWIEAPEEDGAQQGPTKEGGVVRA